MVDLWESVGNDLKGWKRLSVKMSVFNNDAMDSDNDGRVSCKCSFSFSHRLVLGHPHQY